MIKVIIDEPERISKWAEPQIEGGIYLRGTQAFGYELDGELVGAVIFQDYSEHDMHVSVVSTNSIWWQRRYIKAMYQYVFDQCKCLRLSAMANETNKKSNKLLKALGFKEEGRLRQFYKETDAIIYGQLRSECKWIKD